MSMCNPLTYPPIACLCYQRNGANIHDHQNTEIANFALFIIYFSFLIVPKNNNCSVSIYESNRACVLCVCVWQDSFFIVRIEIEFFS